MPRLFSLAFFLLSSLPAFAQKQNVYFLKNDGRYVDNRDSADYYRIVREPDSASTMYNVLEFYKDGKKKLIGKSSTINPITFEETCISYFENGKKQSLKTYTFGYLVGLEYDFFPNGKPYLVKEYIPILDKKKTSLFRSDYNIKENYDSLGTVQVENGNGYFKGFDDQFKYLNDEGKVKDGKMDGVWKGVDRDLKITFLENYNEGKLISGASTDELGKVENYKDSRTEYPEFNGGLEAFGRYLGKNIRYPEDARFKHIQARVILRFLIQKDGKVTDVSILQPVFPSLDAEAMKVMKNSPVWKPGTRFGRNIVCPYSVPISFTLSE